MNVLLATMFSLVSKRLWHLKEIAMSDSHNTLLHYVLSSSYKVLRKKVPRWQQCV